MKEKITVFHCWRRCCEAFPETPINIDIKVNNSVPIKKASELVKQYKREHLTVEQCQLCNCKKVLHRELRYSYTLKPTACSAHPWPFLHWPLALCAHSRTVFWNSNAFYHTEAERATYNVQRLEVSHLAFWYFISVESSIRLPHCPGHPSICLHEYKRTFDLRAAGMMTDYPTKLKDVLNYFSA